MAKVTVKVKAFNYWDKAEGMKQRGDEFQMDEDAAIECDSVEIVDAPAQKPKAKADPAKAQGEGAKADATKTAKTDAG